jgi:hypothetical protein
VDNNLRVYTEKINTPVIIHSSPRRTSEYNMKLIVFFAVLLATLVAIAMETRATGLPYHLKSVEQSGSGKIVDPEDLHPPWYHHSM